MKELKIKKMSLVIKKRDAQIEDLKENEKKMEAQINKMNGTRNRLSL